MDKYHALTGTLDLNSTSVDALVKSHVFNAYFRSRGFDTVVVLKG
jgi:hypothetical protein